MVPSRKTAVLVAFEAEAFLCLECNPFRQGLIRYSLDGNRGHDTVCQKRMFDTQDHSESSTDWRQVGIHAPSGGWPHVAS